MTEMEADPPPSWREQLQAIGLAALCAVMFLGAGMLPGRAVMPFPPEVLEPMRTEALAEGRVTLADLAVGNPTYGDKYNQSLAWDRIQGDRLLAGEFPLWTRDIGGGAAFPPQQGQPYMPWSWLLPWVPAPGVYGLWFFLHQVVFGWLAYRFLRRIGVRHLGALLGVVCVTIGLWTQARIHHNVILSAVLPLFAMLSCVHELCRRGGGPGTAGLLALGTGISWLGGLPQASLMVTYVAAAYAVVLWLGRPRLRPLLWVGAGFALGGLIALAQMGPTLLAAQDSARGAGTVELLAWKALDWGHLLNLVWPDLLAWPSAEWYFELGNETTRPPWAALALLDWRRLTGDPTIGAPPAGYNFPEAAFAIGLPALVLLTMAFGHRRCRREVLFFAVLAVVSLLLALAAEPLLSASAIVPGARAGDLKRFLFPCAMALSVLAALGMDRCAAAERARTPVVVAVLLTLLSFGGLLLHWSSAEENLDRYASWVTARMGLEPELFRAAVAAGESKANLDRLFLTFSHAALIGGATVVLLLLRRRRGALLGLVLLCAFDLAWTGSGPVVAVPSARVTTPPRILEPALEATRAATTARQPRPRFQRCAVQMPVGTPADTLLRPNLGAFFGLEDLAAYNPLPPRRMEELFLAIEPDRAGKTSVAFGGAGVDQLRSVDTLRHPLLDVLGLEYVLTDAPVDLPGLEDVTPAGYPHRFRLYRRTTTLPRATFVTAVAVIEDRAARLAALADAARDARTEVILEDPAAPRPPAAAAIGAAPAEIRFASHTDQRVELSVRTAAAGYLRLADPWDPGWTVTVDGEPAAVFAADHYLRAVYLEAGEHEVIWRYDGARVIWPARLAALGVLGVLCLLVFGRLGRRRKSPVAALN